MRAAVYHGVGDIRLEDVPEPKCGPADILLKVSACGICGTDASSYEHGSVFAAPGDILGHEFSGLVVEVGTAVAGISEDDRVTAWPMDPCDLCGPCSAGEWNLCERVADGSRRMLADGSRLQGAFAEYVLVPHARLNRTVYKLPESVSMTSAAMVEPMSVAMAAVLDARVAPDSAVVVTGLGSVGLCVVQALRAVGAGRIVGVDPAAGRRELALTAGASEVLDPTAINVTDELRASVGASSWGSARISAVFECSGTQSALTEATRLVRAGGYLSLVGLPHEPPRLDVEKICLKELSLRGRFAYTTEYATTIALLAEGRLDLDRLVTHSVSLADIVEGFDVQRDREKAIKVMVNP